MPAKPGTVFTARHAVRLRPLVQIMSRPPLLSQSLSRRLHGFLSGLGKEAGRHASGDGRAQACATPQKPRERATAAAAPSTNAERKKDGAGHAYRHLGRLGSMGRSITASLDTEEILALTCRHVGELMDVDVFAAGFYRPGETHIDFPFAVDGDKRCPVFRLSLEDASGSLLACIKQQREILIHRIDGAAQRQHVTADGICRSLAEGATGTPPLRSAMFVPLPLRDGTLIVLCLYSESPQAYRRFHVSSLLTLADYATVALDNARAFSQLQAAHQQLLDANRTLEAARRTLEEFSLTDPLTGMRNRRFLQQQLGADIAIVLRRHEEWHKSGAAGPVPDTDLAFFLVDIDHFKAVNDQHGHAAGDKVLVQMRERLERVFRESDYLVRWGGEEFLIVARAGSRAAAEHLAERIRLTVSATPFALGDDTPLSKTCSIGFACFPFLPSRPDWLSWQQTVELADRALYIAKHSGRNAWAGLYGSESLAVRHSAERLVDDIASAIESGDLHLASSRSLPEAEA